MHYVKSDCQFWKLDRQGSQIRWISKWTTWDFFNCSKIHKIAFQFSLKQFTSLPYFTCNGSSKPYASHSFYNLRNKWTLERSNMILVHWNDLRDIFCNENMLLHIIKAVSVKYCICKQSASLSNSWKVTPTATKF